ncbi:hypothetical protein [Gracilibacillus kekensis]|uniref:Uncharacterized protein n=1 Tax=Gracilibacillus kekensis TaxID=1027249 RepID=A0A1M7QHF1_9BACI|nr:hypothetical protein [Gracilibacillus kekensis]SHN30170.1 hypothetical protein SAMN05216179_3149 [Gracilibacillus kekensis]
MRKILIFSILFLSFLSACNNEEETVKIEDKDFANILYVQKIENNYSSGELTKPIEDQEKIREVLTIVEGLKAKRITTDEFIQKLENQDNYYRFGFIGENGTEKQRDQYAFQVMDDGTIIFNFDQINNPDHPLVTVTAHHEILEELKDVLGIQF